LNRYFRRGKPTFEEKWFRQKLGGDIPEDVSLKEIKRVYLCQVLRIEEPTEREIALGNEGSCVKLELDWVSRLIEEAGHKPCGNFLTGLWRQICEIRHYPVCNDVFKNKEIYFEKELEK
jgi:hypothetical protein